MRRMMAAVGASLGLHTLAFALSDTYGQLVIRAGGRFAHATDIADIPRLALTGFLALASVAVAVGVILERLDHLLRRGTKGSA